jgi:hypothetical protein
MSKLQPMKPSQPPAPSSPSNPSNPSSLLNILKARFWSAVEDELGAYNSSVRRPLAMDPQCEAFIKDFIDDGCQQITSVYTPLERIDEAEENLRRFARAMFVETTGQGKIVLESAVFFSIKGIFCPGLWPFC